MHWLVENLKGVERYMGKRNKQASRTVKKTDSARRLEELSSGLRQMQNLAKDLERSMTKLLKFRRVILSEQGRLG